MRSPTSFATLPILAASLMVASVLAEDADQPKLGKVFETDSIRFVTATSDDRMVSSMLFDNFAIASSDGKGGLLESRTKSFSLANKIEAKDSISVFLDIRGYVSAANGGKATLIIQIGDETTLVDLKKSIAAAASKPRNLEDPLYVAVQQSAKAAGFSTGGGPKGSEDYMVRVPAKLQKGQPLQSTVLLLVDRLPNAGSSAIITVDSIDVSVKAAPAEKQKPDPDQSPEVAKTEKKSVEKKSTDKPAGKEPEKSGKSLDTKSDAGEKPAAKKTSEKKADSKKSSEDAKSGSK